MAFPLTIYGKFGWEKVVTSAKKNKLGTRMELPDGRVFYYAFSNGTIGAGMLVQQAVLMHANHVRGMTVAAAAALGTHAITITNQSTALNADQYADGTVFVSDATGEGHVYIIKSHPAGVSAANIKFTLDEEDGIADEALSTTSKVGLRRNKFLDVIKYDSNVTTSIPLGVAPVEVADNRYFWCQSWGEAALLAISITTIAGYKVRPFATGTVDGGVRPFRTAQAANTDKGLPSLGIVENASTATGYSLVFLTISR